jgi:hypothetical protein
LSTYTTRVSGAIAWATSCVQSGAGMPGPMSMNWRMPSSTMKRTARRRKARFSWMATRIEGMAAATASPEARSTL